MNFTFDTVPNSRFKKILALVAFTMLLIGCENPGPLGEPETLLSTARCSFYEQTYSDKNAIWKDDPWWVVYLTCHADSTDFTEKLFSTRYPDFYKFYVDESQTEKESVIAEYCQYRSAPSFLDVQNRIAAIAEAHEIGFGILLVENKAPCIAAGSELYE